MYSVISALRVRNLRLLRRGYVALDARIEYVYLSKKFVVVVEGRDGQQHTDLGLTSMWTCWVVRKGLSLPVAWSVTPSSTIHTYRV